MFRRGRWPVPKAENGTAKNRGSRAEMCVGSEFTLISRVNANDTGGDAFCTPVRPTVEEWAVHLTIGHRVYSVTWGHEVKLNCVQEAYQSSRSQSKQAVHLPHEVGD